MEISCEQFVFGKLLGSPFSPYQLVAKSQDLDQQLINGVRQIFKGCGPEAVHVRDFSTALAAAPYSKYYIFLRMERSFDREVGHFIQEHFIIVETENLFNQGGSEYLPKPWLWLLNMASIPQYSTLSILPNKVSLNLTGLIVTQIAKSKDLLSREDNTFQTHIERIVQLLNKPPVAIVLEDDEPPQKHLWCVALSLLLPARELVNLKLFIGEKLPQDWNFSLGIVQKQLPYGNESVNLVHVCRTPQESDSFNFPLPKFSSQLHRFLKFSKSEESIKQLFFMINSVRVNWEDPILEKEGKNLDTAIGIFSMATIGINLAREEAKRGICSPEDLLWIWRHMSPESGVAFDVLADEDWRAFFPLIIKNNFSNWRVNDFNVLTHVIDRMVNPEMLFIEFLGEEEILQEFLVEWIKTNDFSKKEDQLFLHVMEKVASKNFAVAIELFLQWVKCEQDSNINLFDFLFNLVQVQSAPLSLTYLIKIFFNCLYVVESNRDLNQFAKIIKNLRVDKKAVDYYEDISLLINTLDKRSLPTDEKIWQILFLEASDRQYTDFYRIFALYHLAIVTKNLVLFEGLSLTISLKYSQSLHFPARTDVQKEWFEIAKTWVFEEEREDLFAAYIYILIRTKAFYEEQDVLTDLLLLASEDYKKVASLLLHKYGVPGTKLNINLNSLEGIEAQRRFQLLSIHFLSISKTDFYPTLDETALYYQTLITLDKIDSISAEEQAQLISIFQNVQEIKICQKILEHQIRQALGQRPCNFEKAKVSLDHFDSLIKSKTWLIIKSRPKLDICISYFRQLDEKALKEFLEWFLESPLNENPPVDIIRGSPLTSGLVKLNAEWLVTDPYVRLQLFKETVDILKTKIK